MRKGRSSRRSRISRPLVSVKGDALSTDMDLGPASGGIPSPRVVVGVSPSEPPPSESFEAPPAAMLESKAPPTAGTPATARSPLTSTIVRGSVVEDREALPPPPSEPPVDEPAPAKIDLRSTVVHGSLEVPKVETAAPVSEPEAKPSFTKTLAFGSKLNELPQSARVDVAKDAEDDRARERRERLKEKRAQAQEAQRAVSPKEDPDEISVPPANDLGNEDSEADERDDVESEKFFSEADVAVRKSVHEFEMMAAQEAEEGLSEKVRRKSTPLVARRRERFAGYVKIAVASAAIVCLAAAGRSALHSRAKDPSPPQTIAAAPEAPPVVPKAAEPTAAPQPVTEAKPAEPETKPEEPAAAPAPAESAAPAEAPSKAEEIAGDAKEELKKSRTALEKRKIPEAIEAGERSVALDPTDGEAWLILGAAYQEKGDMVNARRCYGACVKQGKSGPRLECQKMLRF